MGQRRVERMRRRVPPCRQGARGERGFTLIEMVMAITVLAGVAIGFAASVHLGFRTVALARQRATASELTSARLERLRAVPFEELALSPVALPGYDVPPAHDPDPKHPNHFVSSDGARYDVTGDGEWEDIVYAGGVDDAAAGVRHVEDPIQVGATVMEIYQYVTWVADVPDVKRVTVVVRYKAPSVTGLNQLVRSSSLFTPGTISFEEVDPDVVPDDEPPPEEPPDDPALPPPSSACNGDPAPGGGWTLSGGSGSEDGYTATQQVAVWMGFTSPCTPIVVNFQNEDGPLSADILQVPEDQPISWTLSPGDGVKTVGGQVRNGENTARSLTPQTIILDSTPPTTPSGSLSAAVSCSGTQRSVTLWWGTSTDDHLQGYRVYRSTDGVSWSAHSTYALAPGADTHEKGLESVRYYVVAYDRAGNESEPTNVVSLAKNKCS